MFQSPKRIISVLFRFFFFFEYQSKFVTLLLYVITTVAQW